MAEDNKIPEPPTGLSRILYRLPIFFYKIGLGGLMGERFILVNHIGRKSQKQRQAVLEVIHSDSQSKMYYVVSAFGEKSQWYQNLMNQPEVEVQVGRNRFDARAERLPTDEGAELLASYTSEHPAAARSISKLIGYEGEGTPEDFRELGKSLPVIRFRLVE